jgi:hypothetical protein
MDADCKITWNAFKHIVADFSIDEKEALFGTVAKSV